jgi:hypothetical protein
MAGEIMFRKSMTGTPPSNGSGRMRAVALHTFSIALAVVSLCFWQAAQGAPERPSAYRAPLPHKPARSAQRPRFRPPRGAAAQDAARLGGLVGKECRGKADMPLNDHEWVVLCSNGRTFVVQPPHAASGGAPPTECSLAGTGPLPACFSP